MKYEGLQKSEVTKIVAFLYFQKTRALKSMILLKYFLPNR